MVWGFSVGLWGPQGRQWPSIATRRIQICRESSSPSVSPIGQLARRKSTIYWLRFPIAHRSCSHRVFCPHCNACTGCKEASASAAQMSAQAPFIGSKDQRVPLLPLEQGFFLPKKEESQGRAMQWKNPHYQPIKSILTFFYCSRRKFPSICRAEIGIVTNERCHRAQIVTEQFRHP